MPAGIHVASDGQREGRIGKIIAQRLCLGETCARQLENPAILAQRPCLGEISARKIPALESSREERRVYLRKRRGLAVPQPALLSQGGTLRQNAARLVLQQP